MPKTGASVRSVSRYKSCKLTMSSRGKSTPVLLSAREARELTDEVRGSDRRLEETLLRLFEGEAWRALGYPSWRAYFTAEFRKSARRGEQLLDHGRVNRAIEGYTAEYNAQERTFVRIELPNEAQARPLAPIAREDPETAGRIYFNVYSAYRDELTAVKVKKAIQKHLGIETQHPEPTTRCCPHCGGRGRVPVEDAA